jgi:hypothetical protein
MHCAVVLLCMRVCHSSLTTVHYKLSIVHCTLYACTALHCTLYMYTQDIHSRSSECLLTSLEGTVVTGDAPTSTTCSSIPPASSVSSSAQQQQQQQPPRTPQPMESIAEVQVHEEATSSGSETVRCTFIHCLYNTLLAVVIAQCLRVPFYCYTA